MRALQTRARPSSWFHLAAALGIGALTNHAAAQQCATDSDCGGGYKCQVTSISSCAGSACRPGTECPPPPPCETKEYRSCVAAPCQGDSDCPDPMVCHLETYDECDDYPTTARPACPPDAVDCVAPAPAPAPPPECRTRTESTCRQPYDLPCTADADCGGGFRCVEQISRWCSGGGRRLADGGFEQVEPQCGETRSSIFHCELQALPCESDAACPTGLTCQDNYAGTVCTDPAEGVPGPTPTRDAGVRDAGRAASGAATPVSGAAAPAIEPAPADAPLLLPKPTSDVDPATPPFPNSCTPVPAQPAKLCRPLHWAHDGRGDTGSSSGGGKGSDAVEGEDATDPKPTAPPTSGSPTAGAPTGDENANSGDRGRGKLKKLIKRYRESRGCAISGDADSASFELSWLAVAGVLAGASLRRKRA
jgi:hypothetical protein